MERLNFEMLVVHSITLFHSAEYTFVELLKTAKKHEIRVNNRQREVLKTKEALDVSVTDQLLGAL